MKNDITEIARLARLLSAKCSWQALCIYSFLWSLIASLLYSRYYDNSILEFIKLAFSPNNGNILQVIVHYLSYGIPMMITIAFLYSPASLVFYYVRLKHRYTIAIARICNIFAINIIWVFVSTMGLLILNYAVFNDLRTSSDLLPVIPLIFRFVLPRAFLGCVYILISIFSDYLLPVLTILTAMIIAYTLIGRLTILSLFTYSHLHHIGDIIFIVIIVLIIYFEKKRDVSI